MADFCKKCFVEKLLTPAEQQEYKSGTLELKLSEEAYFCEGCSAIQPVVLQTVKTISQKQKNPFDKIVDFCKQNFDVLGCSDSHINMLVGDDEYVISIKKLKDGEHWSEKV